MRKRMGIGLAVIGVWVGLALAQTQTQTPVYLKCGWLLDGKSDQLKKDVIIAVDGEKIREVGGTPPASAQIVDLSSETCLPGLIDTHTHILLQGDITAADYDAQLLKQSPEY